MGTEMTDEQLDALAGRLSIAHFGRWPSPHEQWLAVAREAARWAQERERERLEPLRVAVEAERISRADYDAGRGDFAEVAYLRRRVTDAARTLLEQAE